MDKLFNSRFEETESHHSSVMERRRTRMNAARNSVNMTTLDNIRINLKGKGGREDNVPSSEIKRKPRNSRFGSQRQSLGIESGHRLVSDPSGNNNFDYQRPLHTSHMSFKTTDRFKKTEDNLNQILQINPLEVTRSSKGRNFKAMRNSTDVSGLPTLSEETNKKLFGNLTIRDMAYQSTQKFNGSKGGLEYEVKQFGMVPKSKMCYMQKISEKHDLRIFDRLAKMKAMVPSPDKYIGHRTTFIDPKKNSKIMMTDKTSTMDEVIKKAKETPGAGRYNAYGFDERFVKPPRSYVKYMQGPGKYTLFDEHLYLGTTKPAFYN